MKFSAYLLAFAAGLVSLFLFFVWGMGGGFIPLAFLLGFVVAFSLFSGYVHPGRLDIPFVHALPLIGVAVSVVLSREQPSAVRWSWAGYALCAFVVPAGISRLLHGLRK
jgi:hypothetical protein